MIEGKIILVISDKKGKNILFVLDNLQALTLKEAIKEAKKGNLLGIGIVKTRKGGYPRANPNIKKDDNLDSLSIPWNSITKISKEKGTSAVKHYYQRRQQFLKEKEEQREKVIYIDGRRKKTEKEIIKYLSNYKTFIFSAAKKLKADKYLLAAILIDETLRRDWIDDCSDWLAIFGQDRSVGIAQVRISTARDLIRRGFYPADPSDKNITPQNADKLSSRYLNEYINDPGHSVLFVAAKINQVKKDFASSYDISRLDIIADLYSRSNLDSTGGRTTTRGKQIATEFYKIAKKSLNP